MTSHNKTIWTAVLVTVVIPAALLLVFGLYVTIGDGVFVGLVLQGMFGPPNDVWHIVTNGSNRFLLEPMIWLYHRWPRVLWFDYSQIIPGILALWLLLTLLFRETTNSIGHGTSVRIGAVLTALIALIFVENLILYDPLSSTLMAPLLVLLIPGKLKKPWLKVVGSIMLLVALVYAWQMRYHGIFIGMVAAGGLLFIIKPNPVHFFKKYALPLGLVVVSFGLFYAGTLWQDSTLTETEQRINLLDQYVYTLADAQVINTENFDISQADDSVKFIAYYSFYFPESLDSSLAYMQTISYPSGMALGALQNLPMKWEQFWDRADQFVDFDTYHNYNRLMLYMLACNVVFLAFFVLAVQSRSWTIRAILWSLFVWAFFIGLGVTVKMIYKLATPLSFFFIFSFAWFILAAIRDIKPAQINRAWLALALTVLLGIGLTQLTTYQTIASERSAGIDLKATIVEEMNTLFADKLLIFDLFSVPVMEGKLGANHKVPQLKPKAAMFGDFYMSIFPKNREYLEELMGTADFVPFFSALANQPDEVVLVMSAYRINLIKGYLREVKGIELDFVPIEGQFKIEELEYSFYEVPLQLNYYQVRWPEDAKIGILQ